MAEDKYKIDPNIVKMVSDSKKTNYGHAISQMFSELGGIVNDKYNREQKEKNDNLARENQQLQIDTNKLQYQSVADTIHDKKIVSNYIASDASDFSTYLVDNKKTLKTPEWQLKAQEISDNRMNKIWDESLNAHENYLKENGLFLTKDGNIDMKEVRKQLSQDPKNLHLAQAFERKYGTKLEKPAPEKKILSLSEQLKLQEAVKDKKEDELLEKDLVDIRKNYKELFNQDMTTAQELQYKKNGELPYKVYGSTEMKPKDKELIDANIEVEKALSKLDNYTYEDIDSVVGWLQGDNWAISAKDAIGKLTPKQKEILTILGNINSDKMHELYGAALTGGEVGRAKTWNLDTGQSTSSLVSAINELRDKNKIQFKNNTHGVYGVPQDGMAFSQIKLPDENNKTQAPEPTKMSREEKLKFLQGNN